MLKWLYFPRVNYVTTVPEIVNGFCQEIVTIPTTSNGFDFQWSQIEGPEVLLLNPTQPSLQVNLLRKVGVFKFRLIVNRESSMTFISTIDTAPISTLSPISLNTGGFLNESNNDPNWSVTRFSNYEIVFSGESGIINSSTPTINAIAFWDPPLSPTYVNRYYLYELVAGNWNFLGFLTALQKRELNIKLNISYSITTEHLINGFLVYRAARSVYASLPPNQEIVYGQETLTGVSIAQHPITFQVILPVRIVKEETDLISNLLSLKTEDLIYIPLVKKDVVEAPDNISGIGLGHFSFNKLN